jgi:hypothetical protein
MERAIVYIVDYDIPESPAKNKVQFYRDLKKVSNSSADYSTRSVFRTPERMLAEAVYFLVKAHKGIAHIYQAHEIFLE